MNAKFSAHIQEIITHLPA